ncbi:MAG: hypothetical protein ACYDC6_09495 [Acidobacteriaceae bacterium]
MDGFASIAEMMQSCSAEAVQLADDRFGFHLDYSEESVQSLETILSSVSAGLQAAQKQASDKQTVEQEVKRWGGYLGEVVRRRWSGEWSLVQYPGGAAAVPALLVGGSQLYPLVKVYRRLTMGEAENVWTFYQKIRQKLSTVCPTEGPD